MQIEFDQVDFAYGAGTAFEMQALHDVSLTIPDKSFTALVGHTGSGKSTVIQHLNALLLPSGGEIRLGDFLLTAESKGKGLKTLRSKVGMVFQFPESQLFEETVLADVMFGPKNYGASEEEAKERALEALELVGIAPAFHERSPFELSGGQMRRVAIAGILAMKPEVLVLDEPTAGLDPKGQKEMMEMFYQLYRDKALTVVLVSHHMNDVAKYANHVIVMEGGTCIRSGQPEEIFQDPDWLHQHQLDLPDSLRFARAYEDRLETPLEGIPLTVDSLADAIMKQLGRGQGTNEG
ncbi:MULTISPECIES: energy-coupling factor ABC transporter ATP-binding protein [Aerococcus]|uniref:Energy-coupling factor transporter ATP-binding protein EcfA2 n=1 Tax=Aerococcus sanguinicola TaxID=119206 RepID=A0A5N1GPZ7_9LACT|nr:MULTISPECIES: energy-coupling factor ABC transporter ATP-binding protein [Aerococcus]KAA9302386.1 energy-coupling factor ABC transporter ATP-binding protein [Aerococcus sanguinicola]MDK6369760.1 energy-coupling factor ABC transporter ATP-binding protein [Aerococcus sp. UMB9870]MDK6680400.1 energy-coupling factor ABC transporter ATP-binding protein [Aerococcus sp. UMB8608]MDK6687103.1 energy-coupling factor ABC transporter ATP-binding protein [Aerococcus sp. UMB8623]MDK6940322.1 energy-coupl